MLINIKIATLLALVLTTFALSADSYSEIKKTDKAPSVNENIESIGHAYGFFAFYKTGSTEFLGNFANCPNGLYYQGFYFKNSEAAFQWAKFQLAAEHHQNLDMMYDPEMELFFEADGEEAFRLRNRLAQKYKGIFPIDWLNGLRDQIMWQILEAKFQQNPDFAESLITTRPFYLLEHNEKEGRDTYWSDDFTGNGFNMLGKMLMAKIGRAHV